MEQRVEDAYLQRRDTGGGVERVNLSVDSGVTQTHVKSCHRVPGGGYKRPQPCRTASVVSSFPINGGSGRLNDGQHSLVTATVDPAGNISYARKSFKIDNHAPPAVGGLNVAGGQGWRRSRNFAIGWRNPAAGAGAPVSAVRYKLGRPPTNASDGTRVAGADISRLSLRMPSDGNRPLYVWVEDAAGNSDHRTARVVRLRGDTTAPTAAFQSSEDPANPREIRAALRERTSGIASATMEYRPLASGSWRSLGSRRESGDRRRSGRGTSSCIAAAGATRTAAAPTPASWRSRSTTSSTRCPEPRRSDPGRVPPRTDG